MSEPTISVEAYGLALLTEECGEVLQLIGKAGRFGMDTPGVKDALTGEIDMSVTPRIKLIGEIGDLLAAARYVLTRDIVDAESAYKHAQWKYEKLVDPNSKDNLGRRLAP